MHLPSTLNKAFVLVAYLMVLQVSGQQHSAGINTNNPNPNAVLHLVSTNGNQGLLIPQIGTTQRLSMDLSDPENNGLLVYDNDEGEFYYAHDGDWYSLTDDADADPSNEIQTLSKSGNTLTLSGNNSTVNIGEGTPAIGQFLEWDGTNWVPVTPPTGQQLQFAGNILSISNDPSMTTIDFSLWDQVASDDFSGDYNDLINLPALPTDLNELSDGSGLLFSGSFNDLSDVPVNLDTDFTDDFDGDYNSLINQPTIPTLTSDLTNDSGYITSPDDADADATNEIQTLTKSGNSIILSVNNSSVNIGEGTPGIGQFLEWDGANWVPVTPPSAQELQFAGNILSLSNDPSATTIDFSTWDLNASDDFDGDYNSLINQPAIPTSTSDLVNDSGFITSPDDADANATNEIQDLSLAADHTLSLSLSAPTASLAPYMQTLSFTSPNLTISGVDGNTVDLSALNTDNQTVDLFDLTGNILSLSLEDDGAGPYTVDLSTFAIASQAGQNGNYLTTDGTNTSWDPLGALAQLDAVTTTEITDNTITGADLNASVAGNGLSGGGGAAIALNLSGTSGLEIVTDQLQMPEIHPGGTTFGGAGLVITSIDLDSKGRVLSTTTSVLISDRRLKKEISKIDNSLDKIASLNGYTYYLKTDSLNEDLQSGVMAQEIQDVYPHLIIDRPDGYMAVDYQGLIPILLEAIKEQNTIIKGLESKLESQESIITNQESRISGVEKKLDHLLQLGSITE
ncbi:MAG: tail fiber domain-containing protein [Cyclobacteriaceae bacterium]